MQQNPLYLKYHKEHAPSSGPMFDTQLIWRLLEYLRPYRAWISLAIFFLSLARIIDAAVPIYLGFLAQKIINSSNADTLQKELIMSSVWQGSITVFGMLVLGNILDAINVLIKNSVGQKAIYTMRTQVYQHIQHLPLAYFDRHAVGRLMTRTIHDVEQINMMFGESVVPLIGNLLLFVGIFTGISIIDWQIALIFAALLPIVWWLTNRFRYYQRYWYEILRNIISGMNSYVQEHLMGASTIRNFGLHKKEMKQFEQINEDLREANMETFHHFAFFFAAIDFLQNLSLILVFAALVLLAPPDTGFQVGIYFTFSLYALMFFRPLADLAERYNVLQSAMAAAERVFSILDQETEKKQNENPRPLNEINSIVFENVWFAYEGDNWILKGLSFEIHKGESVAVVGVTGAGKSTIMSLLLRLYDFQRGTVKINGHDIRDYSLQDVRRQFSIVLQDPVIFSGTILENIGLYQPNIGIDRASSILDYLNLRSLIERMPQGLHHYLSERGQNISVGEMQLLSLARAVAHERSVLILDEATANIDTQTEQILQNALHKVLKNRTALVIAHRLSTIKDASRILVLHNGVLAETGTHEELLQRKGLYEKFYRLQF